MNCPVLTEPMLLQSAIKALGKLGEGLVSQLWAEAYRVCICKSADMRGWWYQAESFKPIAVRCDSLFAVRGAIFGGNANI